MKKIITMIGLLLLIACSGHSQANNANHLKYRKEIAALNLQYTRLELFKQIETGDLPVIKLFLEAGMSANKALNLTGISFSPLLLSIKDKNKAVTALLLKYKADPNRIVQQPGLSRGDTPLTLSMELSDYDTFILLIKHGGNPNKGGNPAIMPSAFNNMIKYAGKRGRGSFMNALKIGNIIKNMQQKK